MNVEALGYRTDLMVRALEGSEIADRGDYVVVRSPANPQFWWGNFLVVPASALADPPDRWLSQFAVEFPEAGHVALGIDVADGDSADLKPFEAAGLTGQRDTVLTATSLGEPPHPVTAEIRPLTTDQDWAQAVSLQALSYADDGDDPDDGPSSFNQARFDSRRTPAAAGHGAWLGAFRDGELVAHLGVFSDGAGVARFQDVATHPGARRQGLAAALVCHAGQYAIDELGARTLVIIADPDEAAIRVYRSVGFADHESEISLYRAPAQEPGVA